MSNLVHSAKSSLGHLLGRARAMHHHVQGAKAHIVTGAQTARTGLEGAAVGAGLGFLHATLPTGLDFKPTKTSSTVIPLDGVAVLALGGLAISMSGEETATDLRNAMGGAAGAFGFRKGFDFFAAKRKKSGQKVGGVFAGESEWGYSMMNGEESIGAENENNLLDALRRL